MSIRYFATNRHREDLGRDLNDRDQRIGLQRGGYHFVDMQAYMSHYLAEVETRTMPASAIVRDSKKDIFEGYLESDNIKDVVICVHGFNVDFHDAQTWFGILTDSLRDVKRLSPRIVTDPVEGDKKRMQVGKDLMAFIGFSWPSNGNVLSYPDDQREAVASAGALANLIGRVRMMKNAPSVSLICHSMGNYLACNMFKQLLAQELSADAANIDAGDPKAADKAKALLTRTSRLSDKVEGSSAAAYFVDRYVMLAPDVERRHVTKCVDDVGKLRDPKETATYLGPFYSGLEHLCGSVHNFYSRFDGALAISNVEKGPRKAKEAAKGLLDSLTFGMLDFLERNPDLKWEQRLGATQHPMMSPPNMHSHNAVELSGREIGHSDYVDSRPIVEEIARVLTQEIGAGRRDLQK